jgi:hypothetical protein
MRKKGIIRVVLLLAVCFLFAASAYAEVNTSYGANFRLRQETWDNLFDMSMVDTTGATPYTRPDDNYWRLKTSLWFKADADKQYAFYAKLTNEARYFMETSSATSRPVGMNKDEIVFDNLYASANKVAGLPVDLIVGRQDLMTYGEGFLIMDGTPVDGSRTYYFNAAKGVVKFGDNTTVDLIWIADQAYDRALPSLYDEDPQLTNGGKRSLNTTDEQGAIAYGRTKIGENLNLEPYYMYKREQTTPLPYGTNGALKLNTVGVRAVYGFGNGWKLRGEFAHQFGSYDNGNDRTGDGGYAYISRKYEDIALKPSFELGGAYLSGDDPGTTNKVEAWDPLFSRWPWLSELYVLSYGTETGIVGYWTNLLLYRASFKLALDPETGLELSYNYLGANENSHSASAPAIFSADGKKRGDLIQAKLSHKFSKAVDGYLLVEDFVPGNYYADTNRDNAMFIRWELQWKI